MTPPRPPRYPAIDLTRGVAVMGILLLNIVGFAMPGDAYINPAAWGGERSIDLAVWAINAVLFDGRMRGLFALLFGVGTLMLAERSGAPMRPHYARMAVLGLIGLAHGYLLWNGDILFQYAVLGCLLPIAWGWSAGRLARMAALVLVLQTLLFSWQFGGALYFQSLAEAPGASPDLVERYRAMLASFPQAGSASVAADVSAYRGDYGDVVAYHWFARGATPLRLMEIAGGESLGYMLIGMALYRSGALTGGWSSKRLKRLAALGYLAGLPAMIALTAWAILSGFDPIVLIGNFLAWSIPFRVAVTLAHLAVLLLIADRFAGSAVIRRIAAVGRMALTNYLATSLIMTSVFYGHGLALFGRIDRAELYLFVIAMWAAMLTWSAPWLSRRRFGPAEWTWRTLSGFTTATIQRFANAKQ